MALAKDYGPLLHPVTLFLILVASVIVLPLLAIKAAHDGTFWAEMIYGMMALLVAVWGSMTMKFSMQRMKKNYPQPGIEG